MLLTFKYITKYKTYSILNIAGLAVGMACAIFILLWAEHEMNVDKFHKNGKNIYLIRKCNKFSNGSLGIDAATQGALAPALISEIPEIFSAVRYKQVDKQIVRFNNISLYGSGVFVDSNFLNVFSFKLLEGDINTILKHPNCVVISEKLANKFFGKENPVGKKLIIQYFFREDIFTITGVFQNLKNSSLEFDYLIPFSKFSEYRKKDVENWDYFFMSTFILVSKNADLSSICKKINRLEQKHNPYLVYTTFFTQPFEDVYLYSEYVNSINNPTGRIEYVRIFLLIAIFIIFLACMNYSNLSTALSFKRSKEVIIKKVFGANKKILILQFFLEAMIITLIGLFISLILVECLLPAFNLLIEKELTLNYINLQSLKWVITLPLITGTLAGVFPAFYLSSFKPVLILNSVFKSHKNKISLRYVMVIIQFIITISFIISSVIILKQLNYIQQKNLGLNKENIMVLNQSREITMQRQAFKEELKKQAGIINVCYTGDNPIKVGSNAGVGWRGKSSDDYLLFNYFSVDPDFIETFGIDVIEGRNFSVELPADSSSVLINAKAAEIMNLKNPVGEVISMFGRKYTIIGVVNNFHINNLYTPISQLILLYRPHFTNIIMVKINGNMIPTAIKNVENTLNKFDNNAPFNYTFLEQEYEHDYDNERKMSRFSNLFAFLAIFISCLGLFGLALFSTEQKTKEIGIRKSIGASTNQIIFMLSMEFLKLIGIAFIIASILTYYFLYIWLQNFAYRTEISWWVFVLAGLTTLIIAFSTILWQSWKAANRNPVESLRYE